VLTGLQAGVAGVLAMLFWLGVNAEWNRRSFWTAPNLMASTFYGAEAIHSGFARNTITGIALYIVIYSLGGVLFTLLTQRRTRDWRLLARGAAFGIGWYFLWFFFLLKWVSPLVPLLHAARPTLLGNVLYGCLLSRRLDASAAPPASSPEDVTSSPLHLTASDEHREAESLDSTHQS
jgi:hypothetical protein